MDAQSHTNTIPAKHEMDRINTLLRSNYGSYTPDPECISQYLSNTERQMRRNADEIRRLEAQIASIKVEQRGLQWRVFRYRSLLAPIRRLPPEVLKLVFESFCNEGATFCEEIWSPPAQLSRVCVGWRDLARRTPTLWSSLRIEQSALETFSVEKIVSLLTMHLELSQKAPLDLFVSIKALDNEDPYNEDPARLILEMLFSQSTRWRDVNLDLPKFITADLDSLRGKIPLIQFLDISDWEALDQQPASMCAFEIAPSLKALALSYTINKLALPWEQITDFSIGLGSAWRILNALSTASEAREVQLVRCNLSGSSDPQDVPVVHSLTSLSIIVDRVDPDFHHWFKWLTLPNLTSLKIAAYDPSFPAACTSVFEDNCFPSFLSRSSCTITSLSLINLPLSDSDAITLLIALQSLSSLTIHERDKPKSSTSPNTTLTNTFFKSLTIEYNTAFSNRHSPYLQLKRLRSLDLRLHDAFPAKVISDVIVSRWTGNDLEYSAAVGVDSLTKVKILVLRSKGAMVLDVQELHDSLEAYQRLGLWFCCESKSLGMHLW
ncbi:hypothetical protein D9758_003508 [Tetrapyrgos nigripes]|uniref:F-box domain-containing protein n=1 Tax=Tetrapyrgos nigripes TaxID=182062 RepID=A0A8H5LW63_9AGAR|nr:hypothetical protein D9758_003508 [Tetrapyrgos nigripes]